MSTKNDPSNRKVNTTDPDRTLVITHDANGHQHRHFEHVEGISGRLAKAASAPNRAGKK